MKKMFFAVFLVLFILGCTSASGPAGPGLTIREFSFSPTSLTGAQKTSLSLVVQNTGSMDVKEAYAKIFGFGKESGLWNILPQGEKEVSVKPFGLRAQSSFAGNVGEQKKFVWLLQNNDNIPEDMTRTYTANARLCYPYNTTALGRVELMSENEWMSKNQPQHEIVVSQTSAPVRITVLSKQPIISSGRLSLDLLIENVGGGTVAMPGYCKNVFAGGGDATKTPLNELKLEISGLTKEKCTTSVGTSSSIFLEKGKSVKVSADCGIGSESAPVSAADLKIGMGYDYYVDAKANIQVKGPNEGTKPLISEGIVACIIGIDRYSGFSDTTTSCKNDVCTSSCSIAGELTLFSKANDAATERNTDIIVKHPGRELYYKKTKVGTLKDGENKIAVLTCGELKKTVYLHVSEKDGSCPSGKIEYTLSYR